MASTIGLIARLPQEVQVAILDMGHIRDHTTISKWLAEQEVYVTRNNVGTYLRKHGIYTDQKWWTSPADTHDGRMQQYITALIGRDNPEFRMWDLNLRGQTWNACTRALMKMGAIELMHGQKRRWYRIIATKEELAELMESK